MYGNSNFTLHSYILYTHFLDYLQFVRRLVYERVESVPLLSQAEVIVDACEFLWHVAMVQLAVPLLHDNDFDDNILRQANGRPKVAGQGHQQVQNGHQVLAVDTLHTPLRLVLLLTSNTEDLRQDCSL